MMRKPRAVKKSSNVTKVVRRTPCCDTAQLAAEGLSSRLPGLVSM